MIDLTPGPVPPCNARVSLELTFLHQAFYWSKHFHAGAACTAAHPPEREERHQSHWAKSPQVGDGAQWLSCIPTPIRDLLPMDRIPEAGHHPASSAAGTLLVTLPRAENGSLRKRRGNKTQIDPKVQQLSDLSPYLVSTEFMVQESAKSRSSHLTTQTFLHPKPGQCSTRAEP